MVIQSTRAPASGPAAGLVRIKEEAAMSTTEPSGPPALALVFSDGEKDDLRGLDYHLAELSKLVARGLVPETSYATVLEEAGARRGAILRRGEARAALAEAERLVRTDPAAASTLAAVARRADPGWPEAWERSVKLERAAGLEAAVALSREAVGLFPEFALTPEVLQREDAARAEAASRDAVTRARAALQAGDDARVIEICTRRLEADPDQFDCLVLLAFACQRRGRLDEALSLYQRLSRIEPGNDVWREWIATIERRAAAAPIRVDAVEKPANVAPPPKLPPAPAEPRLRLSDVASEFLQDHWQKLILCLAVLLIVVSSNVGAYQLLGPRIWSPAGKCVLGLVYTAMFAGFGAGLSRWGASRAGRIMLLTTLIVVPANFMLAGEMKLLADPSASGLALLAVDALALFGLIRVVVWALGIQRGAWALTAALYALSAFNAAAAPEVVWPFAWQFAVFLAPSAVFLAAVAWLTTWYKAATEDGQREVTYGALGLFAFAFLTGVARTGGFVLHLPPALYAIPVMVTGVACVVTSLRASRFDPDPTRATWLRLGGLGVTALGFALALARPPDVSPLYSGNTLATALIGLALYALLLWRERHPAYLYLGFGALFLAYFGAFYFVVDLVRAVEDVARRALGYSRPLPLPFKSINGLVFSTVLGLLAVVFRRRWKDDRLAWHCHAIGIPFSIACGVFSGFEPKAAVICLSGYTVLYAVAVRVFREPRVIYLAAAALAGAAYFGSGLVGGVTLAEQALLASLIGFGEWAVAARVKRRGDGAAYAHPLIHAAVAMCALAMGAATASALPSGPAAVAAAGAFAVVALVAALANREEPGRALASLAALSGSLGYAFFVLSAGDRVSGGLSPAQFAVAVASAAFGIALLADRFDRIVKGGAASEALRAYPVPLVWTACVQAALAVAFCAWHVVQKSTPRPPREYATLATAFALSGLALGVVSRPLASAWAARLALACGTGAWVALVQLVSGGSLRTPIDYAAAVGGYSLVVLAAGEGLRRFAPGVEAADPDFASTPALRLGLFAAAWPEFLLGSTAVSVVLLVLRSDVTLGTAFTLAAGSAAVLGAARERRSGLVVDVGLWLGVFAALSLTAWRLGDRDSGFAYGGYALTAAVSAVAIWAAAVSASRSTGGGFAVPACVRTANLLSWAVFGLAVFSAVQSNQAYRLAAPALGVNAAALLLLTTLVRRPNLTYRSVTAAVFAVYVVVFSVGKGSPDTAHVPGMIAVGLGLMLHAVGFTGRAKAGAGWEPLYLTPVFRSALVLTTLGAALSYWSAVSMVMAGVSYLALVKGLPSRRWIYPAVVSWFVALYSGYLVDQPHDRLVTAAMVVAYQLWIVGRLVRRAEPALVRWLRLPQSGYDAPWLHLAVVGAGLAVCLRTVETTDGTLAWTDSAGLAWNLAVFALLMTRAYPQPAYVHAAVLLATTGVVMSAAPRVEHRLWWLPVVMASAVTLRAAAVGAGRFVIGLGSRLGLEDAGYARVFGAWSWAYFGSAEFAGAVVVVVLGVVASVFDGAVSTFPPDEALRTWGAVLATMGLGGVFVTSSAWDRRRERAWAWLGSTLVLAVWWLGAPVSPVVTRWGLGGDLFLPPATAALALAFVAAAVFWIRRPGWYGAFWWEGGSEDAAQRLDAYAVQSGLLLALAGSFMTLGRTRPVTPATFLAAAAALGLAALARRWVASAYACGVVGCAAGLSAALLAATRFGVDSGADRVVFAAVGLVGSVALLVTLAGVLRRSPADPQGDASTDVALAFERVALVASVFCASGVVSTVLSPTRPADRAAAGGVVVLIALAVVAVVLLRRWGSVWLVYASQGAGLGSYLYYRWAFPLPAATDAIVLTLFGYLDFGLAEAMHRVGLGRYAGPTRRFALAVPLIPLVLAFWGGPLAGSRLFLLFAAATFYGVACVRLQSKTVGYAAAVLYNAALWVLWSQFGWTLVDRPQFFLVPVGLTAVLLAEVSREALGRNALNAVRGVGLTTVYLSLALPTWQFASLGSWLTLLLLSLAGIFAGIGLRVQTFLWLGLTTFVLDVVYQLGRVGMENTLAKWAIMLALGIGLVLFVALNEKKQILNKMRTYFELARGWE